MLGVRKACSELADTLREIKQENDRLKAENARLREERDTYRDLVDCMVHPDIPDQLAAENAKLRELIAGAYKDMDAWQRVIASSDQWGYGKGCLERLCRLQDAMRELGMEVM